MPVGIASAITDPGGSGQIQITTTAAHGLITGQNVFISGVTGTTEANNWDSVSNPTAPVVYWPIQVTGPTTYLLIGSVFVHAFGGGGNSYPALFAASAFANKANSMIPDGGRLFSAVIAGIRAYGYLTPQGPRNASWWSVTVPLGALLVGSTAVATSWQMGVYSPGFGFPSCVTFHQNRFVLGGPGGAPEEVDGSFVGQYENFAASDPTTLEVADDNAYSFQLNSADANVLHWLASTAQGLLAGTAASEWCMTPSSNGGALTPTDFNAEETSFFGSAPVAPVKLGNGTLYVQNAFRKVREMSFFFQAGTFRSIDMTELSEHITLPTVIQLAATKETQPLIWGVRSDGALVSLIYNRDDVSLVAGWTRHFLGGQSDPTGTPPIVSSIASIPSPDQSFDQLWLVVQRYVNGAPINYIEYMTKIFDDSILQEDAFQGDCGGTFYNPIQINTISTGPAAELICTGPTATSQGLRMVIESGSSEFLDSIKPPPMRMVTRL